MTLLGRGLSHHSGRLTLKPLAWGPSHHAGGPPDEHGLEGDGQYGRAKLRCSSCGDSSRCTCQHDGSTTVNRDIRFGLAADPHGTPGPEPILSRAMRLPHSLQMYAMPGDSRVVSTRRQRRCTAGGVSEQRKSRIVAAKRASELPSLIICWCLFRQGGRNVRDRVSKHGGSHPGGVIDRH